MGIPGRPVLNAASESNCSTVMSRRELISEVIPVQCRAIIGLENLGIHLDFDLTEGETYTST